MGNLRFRLLLVFQLVAAAALLAVMLYFPGEWNAQRWAGLIIAVPAIVLLFIARFQLGRSFAIRAEAHELVSHGIYSKIRNPIYVFGGLMILGFALVLQKPAIYLIFLVLIPMQVHRARKEATVLEAKFGEQYRRYREQTWF